MPGRQTRGVLCSQVLSSGRLAEVLGAVLVVGNAVNQGTLLGNATAFRTESLLKLSSMRVSP